MFKHGESMGKQTEENTSASLLMYINRQEQVFWSFVLVSDGWDYF